MSSVKPEDEQSSSNIQSPVASPLTDGATNSSSTDTADGPYDDMPHDMMTSSYTEISFGESDLEDGIEIDENDLAVGDSNKNKSISGSLSLPQLSSTIIDWSEKAKAEYEAEYGDNPSQSIVRPSTGEKESDITGNIEYSNDGMISFVTHDLESKLRLSSVTSSPSSSSTDEQSSSSNLGISNLDITFLNKLESQAQIISTNLDQVMKYIANYTCQVTNLTLKSVNNLTSCLDETCDSIDVNIKSMYQLMAKYEELGSVMAPIDKLSEEVKEVKRLLMLFEREMETNRYQH
ncbi:BLOC-1-related complex subunit 6-like [Panonychus citri]|uniref:BLOC-1-related complex subunit 6-like n=1 Tax=Panonychus citri TaxID=50023 RepID=UPI002307B793|nr:BLOC-1-related complex subunit 6-like [Panonychus citri]